ncbi:hypothetical protein BHS07_17600 [Myxococcus xanthus]|uniref:Iron-containing redox enzyme family protein n=2 Tax=Myxococcaceae TaxID=31 RepID=A0AAE6G095_MYXXA|nr:hypothetical protein BHS09_17395 [Myxococcus xanthus]QDE75893.1 hypothetical protein BHS08_17410 [Myxococcus xanthus]QDE83226.1 hypothetical protein BHS07_17600 [Myxococcus xanthus]QDE97456.1 hypothetical protein BHS05_17275 [Myxococcus xanthus]QDF05089.1 hypothetical protein BHS04_18030 [Myxococcus xanthus]
MNMSKQLVEELYTPNLTATRERIKTDPRLKVLLDDKADPALFEAFLITWNSLGVYMTEPVDGWIRRAGEATVKVGLDDVGQKLIAHAKHEAGHHLMMVEDTKHLVARWNERRSPKLNAEELIAQPPTEAMKEYREIHENTITGEMPAAQVAIEYEIEGLSTVLGPVILEQAKRVCGEEILQGMSFLKEHTEIDVGHTALNEVMLNKLLSQVPDKAPIIAKTGASALDIYLRFMGDCVERAGKLVQSAAAA